MDVGVPSLIKKAVLGFYTEKEISLAKELLFKKCDPFIIGSFKRRITTSSRTDMEANVEDIIEVLKHLDGNQSRPIFAVSSNFLNRCPKSSPEELNDISVVDRVSQLENTVQTLKQLFEATRCTCPCPSSTSSNSPPRSASSGLTKLQGIQAQQL